MIDYNNEIISNEEILLGDKISDNPKDRNMTIRFILKSMNYDKERLLFNYKRCTNRNRV